jgi:glycylpeptide N-tetradecanoyltransferase
MPFTSIAETLAHPSYATAVWNLDPHREGFAPVAAGCGGPLNLYWQIHGEGPIKVVVRLLYLLRARPTGAAHT